MEVRIKQGEEMIDATIEMVDGVMVVSPKKVKFEPKDGDVLSCFFKDEYLGTFVFEETSECGEAIFYFALDVYGKFIKGNGCNYFGYIYNSRPATEEEKQKLFDKLAEEGLAWDAERKELVKLKLKPKMFETYYAPACYITSFEPCKYEWTGTIHGDSRYNKGWAFKTEQECQEFCDRLNEAINSVKP